MRVVRAAAVQISPVLYSREATVEKVARKIYELGQQDRRTFVGALTLGLLSAPLAAEAQRAVQTQVPRLGVLFSGSRSSRDARRADAFVQGLHELGYGDSQVRMEYRWAEGHPEHLPKLAMELVIPIVMIAADPLVVGSSRASPDRQRTSPDSP